MFSCKLMTAYGEVTLSLSSKTGNENAELTYTAVANPMAVNVYGSEADLEEAAIGEVEKRLLRAYTPFGHILIDDSGFTNPIDLDFALQLDLMREFDPKVIKGADLVKRYDPGVPEGVFT